jgi:3',5'-cyclic AMP phosphodiesterase CpdA
MRLIHLTDPHLTSLENQSLAGLSPKRSLSYLSWRRKRRFKHDAAALEFLTRSLLAEQADQILVTGDLTHIGLADEIRVARTWLESLGAADRVMLVPGNHDLMAGDSWGAASNTWGDYLHLDTRQAGVSVQDAFPIIREFPEVAIIGVSSAHPTPILMASGSLGSGQLGRLEDLAEQVRKRGKFCCLMIHHPPIPGIVGRRRALADAAQLESLLERQSIDLVLHGHTHRNEEIALGGRMIYSTASASSITSHAPAAYRVIDVQKHADGWQVSMALKSLVEDRDEAWSMQTIEQARWHAGS